MLKNLKIKQKIIAAMMAASLIPFLVISLFSFFIASGALRSESEKKLELFEEQKKADLSTLFEERKSGCLAFASTSDIYGALNIYKSVGGDISSPDWKAKEDELNGLFSILKKEYNSELINLFNAEGKVISSTDKSIIGLDLSSREYFKRAVKGEVNNSSFFYSDVVKDNITAFAAPVYANGESGEIIGVFSMVLKTADITSHITKDMDIMGKSADAYLVGADGTVMSIPKFEGLEVFKSKLATKPMEKLSSAINAKDVKFGGMDEYADYRGEKVLGKYSVIMLGDIPAGIIAEIDSKEAFSSSNMLGIIMMTISVIAIILIIVAGLIFSKKLSEPVIKLKELMAKVENGDLSVKGEVSSKDEIGQLVESFNNLIDRVRGMIRNIYDNTLVLNKSSGILINTSEAMAAVSEETNAKTGVVSATVEEISASMKQTAAAVSETSSSMNVIASAVEEMSGTIRNLASASEQTSVGVTQTAEVINQISGSISNVSGSAKDVSSSVNSVATAVKEINISLNEISRNCERSINITSDADTKAKDTNAIIGRLNESSRQIGKIVNVINDIADQTNMLALNAAIEAAGAGEAGKGFAVVANEVKELAKQTAEATDEIGQQIETMQGNMSGAVKAVETITEVIKEMISITNTIAAAVTEQSATTGEISSSVLRAAEKVNVITQEIGDIANNTQNVSRSINESSKGVREIARSAAELSTASNEVAKNTEQVTSRVHEVAVSSNEVSKGANEIAQNISEISTASSETASGAVETSNSAKTLSEIARKLEELVRQFKV